MNAKLLSVLATLVLVSAVVLLIANRGLLGHGPITIGMQVAALLLMLWARITFGWRSFHFAASPTAGGLITIGPFRYIRHPIYTSALLFTLMGIVANWSLLNALLGLIITGTLLVRILSEEKLLREHYPEYANYARKTKRVIPFVF